MNREQARAYTRVLDEMGPEVLATLLPNAPPENYRFIRAFGEGKAVSWCGCFYKDNLDFDGSSRRRLGGNNKSWRRCLVKGATDRSIMLTTEPNH